MTIAVELIPIFSDNYVFAIVNTQDNTCLLVDPGESKACLKFIESRKLNLKGILLTHHHWDHISGLEGVLASHQCQVYGSTRLHQQLSTVTTPLEDGQCFHLLGCQINAIATPGHTLNHLCYHFAEQKFLFVGDTLFSLGCGRLFEGTPQMMWESLLKIRRLPDKTLVYCAHEYTVTNTNFALSLDPENQILKQYLQQSEKALKSGSPTIPVTLENEKKLNPFLRADLSEMQSLIPIEDKSPVSVFTYIRNQRNSF